MGSQSSATLAPLELDELIHLIALVLVKNGVITKNETRLLYNFLGLEKKSS